jgi:prevent-host-death family protein
MRRVAELPRVAEPQSPAAAGALIDAVHAMPVCITRGGTPVAVMLSAAQYEQLQAHASVAGEPPA